MTATHLALLCLLCLLCLLATPATPARSATPATLAGTATARFVQVSDLHLDPLYVSPPRSNAYCHASLALHRGSLGTLDSLDSLGRPGRLDTASTDSNTRNTPSLGAPDRRHFGFAGSACDAPPSLLAAVLAEVRSLATGPDGLDGVFWTGDTPRHDRDSDYPRKRLDTYTAIQTAIDLLVAALAPPSNTTTTTTTATTTATAASAVPIYPVIGNWDVYPPNVLAAGPTAQLAALYDVWKALWRHRPDAAQISESFLAGGWYAMRTPAAVIVGLNTLYWFEENDLVGDCEGSNASSSKSSRNSQSGDTASHWKPKEPPTPGQIQLDWLESVLSSARSTGESVVLLGHVPPISHSGDLLYKPKCADKFTAMVAGYAGTVIAAYYGHLNRDAALLVVDRGSNGGGDGGEQQEEEDADQDGNGDDNGRVEDEKTKRGKMKRYGLVPLTADTLDQVDLDKHTILTALYISPSVVPALNPAFRHITIKTRLTNSTTPGDPTGPSRSRISAHVQHYINLPLINKEFTRNASVMPEFRRSCSTRDVFGMAAVDGLGWTSLVRTMQQENSGSSEGVRSITQTYTDCLNIHYVNADGIGAYTVAAVGVGVGGLAMAAVALLYCGCMQCTNPADHEGDEDDDLDRLDGDMESQASVCGLFGRMMPSARVVYRRASIA